MKNKEIEPDFLKTDFSAEGNREKIKKMAMDNAMNLTSQIKEDHSMKMNYRKATAAAVAVFCLLGFSMTGYGQSIINIIKETVIGSGHATYFQTAENPDTDMSIPEALLGQIFDSEGNMLAEFPKEGMIYNANGEQAWILSSENGPLELVTSAQMKDSNDNLYTYVSTLAEAAEHLAFTPLSPSYLPEGYAIENYMLFNEEDGTPVSECEYLQFYITNGDINQDIYVQLRLMNEETAYAAGIGDFSEIQVNGYPGIVTSDGMNIDYEADGNVMVMVSAGASDLSAEEVMKIAESFQ